MGNFIATQVDPENQESPLMEYGMDDIRMQEVVIIGDYNRRSGNPVNWLTLYSPARS